jgi:hypothetical protein
VRGGGANPAASPAPEDALGRLCRLEELGACAAAVGGVVVDDRGVDGFLGEDLAQQVGHRAVDVRPAQGRVAVDGPHLEPPAREGQGWIDRGSRTSGECTQGDGNRRPVGMMMMMMMMMMCQ